MYWQCLVSILFWWWSSRNSVTGLERISVRNQVWSTENSEYTVESVSVSVRSIVHTITLYNYVRLSLNIVQSIVSWVSRSSSNVRRNLLHTTELSKTKLIIDLIISANFLSYSCLQHQSQIARKRHSESKVPSYVEGLQNSFIIQDDKRWSLFNLSTI